MSEQTIGSWLYGSGKPNYKNRKALFIKFGIDMDAWDRPVRKTPGAT